MLRKKYQIPLDCYLCGSFQRDTEGKGISLGNFVPKLEKGPDLFADAVDKMRERIPNLHVLLAGWRRQYLINEFNRRQIPYTYFELPSHDHLIELYQTLDLYLVTARHEGGPQSIIECGLLDVPCVSTPVGIAEQILPSSAIDSDVTQAKPAVPDVEDWKLPEGYQGYRDLIESL